MQDALVGDAMVADVKSADQRLSSSVSTPESSTVPIVQPLVFPVMQPQWPSSSEAQWTSSGVVVSPSQQAAAVPAVSLAPGSVLPLNLLPTELSSLLGMTQSSAGLSASGLPVNVLLPGGLIVSADSGNVQDPLASLCRLSTGVSNIAPATNINNNSVTAEARKMLENANGPHTSGIKVEPETTSYLHGISRQASTAAELRNRLTVSIPEPSKLPGELGGIFATCKTQHPQKASTVGSQLPIVTGSQQSMPSSANFPALHHLLVQGITNRGTPAAPPAYTKVTESTADAEHSSINAESITVGRRRWISADSGVVNHRSWSYPVHSADVAANLFRQESSGFDISKTGSSPVDSRLADSVQNPNADKDKEFSAPSGLVLPHKFRRKHRPQPLIIPSPVGQYGFYSRLRSPRISDQPGPGLSVETSSSTASDVSSSLPVTSVAGLTPYTPPPMLSPIRTGSGLFCSIVQPSPKSAPVGFRLGLLRCSK